jgi:hypothetical protein
VAEQPHRGVVHVDEPAVRALHGDRVRDAGEDRLELVAGESQLAVQARVLEVQRAAVGQLLGGGQVLRP